MNARHVDFQLRVVLEEVVRDEAGTIEEHVITIAEDVVTELSFADADSARSDLLGAAAEYAQ